MSAVVSERPNSELSAGIPGFDRFSWYFLRVSGLALVILACGHLFITHYLNVPSQTTFEFVSNRWSNPLWRAFDTTLLLLAIWHGILGLRGILIDWIRGNGWRVALTSLAWLTGLIFSIIGIITIFTFDAQQSLDNSGPLADADWIADAIGFSLFAFAILTYLGGLLLVVYVIRHLSMGTRPVYRGDLGQYAWIIHRLTGLGVLFFLLVHIIDIMLIGFGQDIYDKSVEFYSNPFLIPMEIALVGAVIYHTLNGLRIVLIDFWSKGVHYQKRLFWIVAAGSILLTIPSAIIILQHEL